MVDMDRDSQRIRQTVFLNLLASEDGYFAKNPRRMLRPACAMRGLRLSSRWK
jgi:hypothetical protein